PPVVARKLSFPASSIIERVGSHRHPLFFPLLLALLFVGCAASPERAWRRAEELWQRRDPAAFAAWKRLDANTVQGARARDALATADGEYRRGIELLAKGEDGEAR